MNREIEKIKESRENRVKMRSRGNKKLKKTEEMCERQKKNKVMRKTLKEERWREKCELESEENI